MKEKILLIDGHSIANRAFYGLPILTNKDGEYTNAVYGFLNILISMIEEEQPKYVAVAFDLSGPTFRHLRYEAYKGTRKGAPAEFRPQIPLLKEVLDTMNIKRFEVEGYEADDILGTLAKRAEAMGILPVIVSGDRDMLQITSDHIKLKIPTTRRTGTEVVEYFAKDVLETYGVTPVQYIDVKGLMGDPSDNIPGVPGVGEKTALRLIKEYNSVENVIANIPNIKQKKLSENLATYQQQAIDSKELSTIVTDMDLELNLEELEYNLVLNPEGVALFQRLEFKNLLTRLPHEEGAYDSCQQDCLAVENIRITKMEDLQLLLKELRNVDQFAYLCVYDDNSLCGFTICFTMEKSYWIESSETFTIEEIIHTLTPIFEEDKIKKITYNSKEDLHTLTQYDVSLNGLYFDTMIAAYVLYPTNSSYDIDEIAHMFLSETHKSTEVLLGKGKKIKSIFEIPAEERTDWIGTRGNIIYRSYKKMQNELKEYNQEALFFEMEMPLVKVLFDMEHSGIKVATSELTEYGKKLEDKIQLITKEIYDFAGEEFNINSPKQLGVILFEKLEIPPLKKTKTGYSTSAEVLDKLKTKYPIVEKILEYRQLAKLKSTYVDGLFAVINQKDGKIHSTFNQTITATGRISSTEPNLQNIPIKMELGRQIRKVFIPSNEDYVFVDADYSQIELRVLAHIADDPILIEAFQSGQDIHRLTASQVFNIPIDEVTSLQRSNAKAVNFGIVYGISAYSLSEDLGITQKEAKRYIEGYFEKYPKVKQYLDDVILFAKENGYVETLFQRRRSIPEINSRNFNVRGFGERVAMNTPIQGSAADIIKLAMIKVYSVLKQNKMRSRLILTVHDELLVEAHKEEVEEVTKILKSEMENAASLSVPLSVDLHVGNTWYETK